ncbi:MAG: putative glycoside hydrolase [Patescibacteria group bacterium]|nr:putative glycoside hydrolase [Patescibacteria group bacterium]
MRKKRKINKIFLSFFAFFLIIAQFFYFCGEASAKDTGYPKLANYFLAWDVYLDADITNLARWDLVILSPQSVERNPQLISKLKQKNPSLKILAYVPIQEITHSSDLLGQTSFWTEIFQNVDKNGWWLENADGSHVNFWPGNWFINASSMAPKTNGTSWLDYLPNLVNKKFLKNNLWDGVFYDNVWYGISWLNQPVDLNGDGIAEDSQTVDKSWQTGLSQILTTTRSLAPNKIIMANTNTNFYNSLLNGRMLENFPAPSEGGWRGSMNDYLASSFPYSPSGFIVNGTTNNSGDQTDYQPFRFGLTSALMGNGYYTFDFGDQGHDRIWWYDEYNFYLGDSKSSLKNLLDPNSKDTKPSVYQREFQNALVLVNSTNTDQKINFDVEYEKIKGAQDPAVNNGSVIKNIELAANDGVVLLRRIEEITNDAFYNGSFIRVFNTNGDSLRNGFFLYESQFRGNNEIENSDVNEDGQNETIVADESKITIYDKDQNVVASFYPYGTKYNKGINFVLSDINGDDDLEVITGTLRGYAPQVKIFSYTGKVINSGFYAYSKNFQGGVNVAVCDLNGNGQKTIVTGAGYNGGSLVKTFNASGNSTSKGFYAYAKTFIGGAYVACGDVNGDNKDEIVTGAGQGGSPQVRIFNNKFQAIGKSFWPFEKSARNGVRVIANDLDGNGQAEILAATPYTFTTSLK